MAFATQVTQSFAAQHASVQLDKSQRVSRSTILALDTATRTIKLRSTLPRE
jgi:hypothetical protein